MSRWDRPPRGSFFAEMNRQEQARVDAAVAAAPVPVCAPTATPAWETPEAMAARLRWEGRNGVSLPTDVRSRDGVIIRARDEQVAARLEAACEAAENGWGSGDLRALLANLRGAR